MNKDENKENNKKNSKNKEPKIAILILCIIAVVAIAAAAIMTLPGYIKNQKEENEYLGTLTSLMESYVNVDTDEYLKICAPGDLTEAMAKSSYNGDMDKMKEETKSQLSSKLASIENVYGDNIKCNIEITNIKEGNESDYKYIHNQLDGWTDTLGANDADIAKIDRVTFTLDIKGDKASDNIKECSAVICNTKQYGKILWDWNFNDAEWDN